MKASSVFAWLGFFLVAFGTTSDWRGMCLYLGIWALFMSNVLDIKNKEDK
jgi:membrane-associated PAP2 superfamily phosphatase